MLKILGVSFGFHDSSAALVIDGKLIAGTHEERFTRIKHDDQFPQNAINYCLKKAQLTINEIDQIVYHENSSLKMDRIIKSSINNNNPSYLSSVIDSWLSEGFFSSASYISQKLSYPIEKISYINHHDSHAASAFLASPFEESAVLNIDAVGEYETTTIYQGVKNKLIKLQSYSLPNSIGLMYSAFTSFLGFEVNEGEYKVMGMAAFGDHIYQDKIKETFSIDETGEIKIDESYFEFLTPTTSLYKRRLCDLFGPPRDRNTPFFTPEFMHMAPENLTMNQKQNFANINKTYADIASSLQKITEDIILKLVRDALKRTGSKYLCMAGGVALNSVANSCIRETYDLDGFFIQPAAGDSGTSLGAALHYTHCVKDIKRDNLTHSYLLGSSWTKSEIKNQLDTYSIEKYDEIAEEDKYYDLITDLLIDNKVIGWFNGSSEWGPRALGSRSIIADPRNENTQDMVNKKIKFREPFRPFAPSVLAEHAKEWFEFSGNIKTHMPESYMLTTAKVKKDKQSQIPAVIHVDGTARIQLVWEEMNPEYYKLILSFYKKTAVPIILNTSFNIKGEPIVNSPYDAIITFTYCDMDYLAIPPFIVKNYFEFGGRHD